MKNDDYSHQETGVKCGYKDILNILNRKGEVSVGYLAKKLDVSEVTIRKDLTALEKDNKLYRSHGKAIIISPYIYNRHVNIKEKLNVIEKRIIAQYAAKHIDDDDTIIIASGTSVLEFARAISQDKPMTVITSSTQITSILSQNKNTDVIQLGGMIRLSSMSTVGTYAESMMRQFFCSKLYIGVDGIDVDYGLTTTSSMEASLNVAMMESAEKTIILADSSKFGKRGFSKICEISDVDQIVTDSGISAHTLSKLQDLGIDVVVLDI